MLKPQENITTRRSRIAPLVRRITPLAIAALGATGLGALAYAAGVEPNWIEVCREDIVMHRLSPEFDGYRVVQISDLHAGDWLPDSRLAEIIELINREEPDIVAITGDFVTQVYRHAPSHIVPYMREIEAKDAVVAVLGNHDYWGKPGHTLIRRIIRESGMIDLNNEVHTVKRDGAAFHIAGVDSAREHADRLDLLLKKLPAEGAAMLLAHEPDFADKSAATGRFDLQISGHSHGGQIVAPLIGPPRLPPMGRKYYAGRYQIGDMVLYTNRGLGMVGLPFRFGARPEITVFTLHSGYVA